MGIGVFNYAMGLIDGIIFYIAFINVHPQIDDDYFWEWVHSDKGLYYLKLPFALLAISFLFYLLWTAIAVYWLPRDIKTKRLKDAYWYYDPTLQRKQKEEASTPKNARNDSIIKTENTTTSV